VRANTLEGIHRSLTLNLLFQDGNTGLGRDINQKNNIFILDYAT
jgi:hypothetical protein